MATATFDTLKFANTLKAAGVPDKQAEAQAVAFAEIVHLNFKELVTKDDLERVAADLRKDLKQDNKDVEQRLTVKIDAHASDTKTQFAQVRGEMYLIRWMLGVLVTGVLTILVRLFVYRGGF